MKDGRGWAFPPPPPPPNLLPPGPQNGRSASGPVVGESVTVTSSVVCGSVEVFTVGLSEVCMLVLSVLVVLVVGVVEDVSKVEESGSNSRTTSNQVTSFAIVLNDNSDPTVWRATGAVVKDDESGLIGWSCDQISIQLPAAQDAKIGDYPFMVSVQTRVDASDETRIFPDCSGVIVTEKHILTKAYCVIMDREDELPPRVMAGGLHALENSEEKTQQFRIVSKITVMPKDEDTDEGTLPSNDRRKRRPAEPAGPPSRASGPRSRFRKPKGILAILELETALEFGPEIGPASLPDNKESFPVFDKEGSCVTLGWGHRTGAFRWTNTTAISDEECVMRGEKRKDSTRLKVTLEDPEAQMCVADKERETFRPLCFDHGSPLICEDHDGTHKVFGIATDWNYYECDEFSDPDGFYEDEGPHLYIFSRLKEAFRSGKMTSKAAKEMTEQATKIETECRQPLITCRMRRIEQVENSAVSKQNPNAHRKFRILKIPFTESDKVLILHYRAERARRVELDWDE
ncbi:unnamed protein product, partial [Cyprideis torosa]